MHRDLAALSNQSFDVLVIGGGIHGACAAYEAALRGLSVTLVEQSDFASGTSANSLKVIHGGLRYLQTADFRRMRQSIKERQTLMRIAPHLVHPMPVLVPTYGHGIKGKEAMTVALKMNDVISGDRNFPLKDPQKHIPPGRLLSKAACLEQLPDLPTDGLTGAAQFYDAQVYNSEQLVLAFVQSAAQYGAQVANYLRVVGIARKGDRVTGAVVQDQLGGDRFTIQAKTILNASGPWIDQLVSITKEATGKANTEAATAKAAPKLAKAMNLVTRPLFGPQQKNAVGITGRASGSRLFFVAPWRGKSLVGTWYGPNNEAIYPPAATTAEVTDFLTDINQAYPTFNLTPDDVEWVHCGLLPSDGVSAKTGDMKLTKSFQLKDHRRDGLKGLLSIKGVKYTTARDLARKAVDWVFLDQQRSAPPSYSHKERLCGGDIQAFDRFMAIATKTHANKISPETIKRLVHNYGSEYSKVLQEIDSPLTDSAESDKQILAAEVRYSLRNTMPQTLADVVFRRTELGATGHPGNEALQLCSQIMSEALGWSPDRQAAEMKQVLEKFGTWQRKEGSSQPSLPRTSAERSLRCAV